MLIVGCFHSTFYSGGLNTKNWNTKHIGILTVLKFGFPMVRYWSFSVIAIAKAMVPTMLNPNHWKSSKMAAILFKTEHHWKTEQGATTIGILNAFGIPAPTVKIFSQPLFAL